MSEEQDFKAPEEEMVPPPSGVEAPESDIQLEIQKLREENSDLKDQFLRKVAETDNFRKRMMREKEDSIRYANSQLLIDVITLLDDFERAISSSQSSKDFDGFHQGIQMIEGQFVSLLERKHGLKRLIAKGESFDPEFHEAIAGTGGENPVIVEEFQKGYVLHDRVLRPARVKVGSSEELNQDNAVNTSEKENKE